MGGRNGLLCAVHGQNLGRRLGLVANARHGDSAPIDQREKVVDDRRDSLWSEARSNAQRQDDRTVFLVQERLPVS